MNNNTYKELLKDTLKILYPNYLKKNIISKMSESGKVINSKRKSKNNSIDNILDVSELSSEDEKLNHILEYNFDLYKYIEEFEFNKSYRYSTMFKISQLDDNIINSLVSEKKIRLYQKESNEIDTVDEFGSVPIVKVNNDNILIKFSYLIHPKTDYYERPIKYIVLCYLDLKNSIVELRFDKMYQDFCANKNFYADIIGMTKRNLINLFGLRINNIDIKAIVEYIRLNIDNEDKIHIYAMNMHRNGSIAYLDSMSNEDMVVPILGELKQLLLNYKDLFNSNNETIRIKSLLDDFIENIEVMSDLSSVKILWRENGAKVCIKHDYKGNNYSLFSYYDELLDSKEKMDYVRNYFIQYYNKLNAKIPVE